MTDSLVAINQILDQIKAAARDNKSSDVQNLYLKARQIFEQFELVEDQILTEEKEINKIKLMLGEENEI